MQAHTKSLLKLKALADETRFRLFHLLYHHELNVHEVQEALEMGQSRISRHLKILADAGLLQARRDGLWVFYSAQHAERTHKIYAAFFNGHEEGSQLQEDLNRALTLLEERSRKTTRFFNSIAEDWDRLKRDILNGINMTERIVRHVPECITVADLGCGTGELLLALTDRAKQVIGVDNSPNMLEKARQKIRGQDSRITLRLGELEHLPLRDQEADCAVINMVLHHLAKPLDSLREACRIVKEGDTLLVVDFQKHSNENMRRQYGDRWLGFEKLELEGFLHKAGFTLKDYEQIELPNKMAIHVCASVKG